MGPATGQLTSTLIDMIEHGTGAAAYYTDVMEAIVTLAVAAPRGPPAGAADFLSRLDIGWLGMAYSGAGHEEDAALLRSAARHVTDISLRFRTLFRRLGPGLDGAGGFGDADAWYCILEGTADVAVAEAQARALVDLLAQYAAHGARGREILLAVDEFSAVSRLAADLAALRAGRAPLGLAVQVSAQSWQGLAPDDDDRYRLAATADGGIWLLRTPHPEPVTALAGNRPVTGHQPAPARRAPLGPRGLVPDPGGDARRRPALYPPPRGRPGRLHLPRRRDFRAGQTAGRGTGRAGRAATGLLTGRSIWPRRPPVTRPGWRTRPGRRARPRPRSQPTRRHRPAQPEMAAADVTALLDEAFGTEPG